MSGFIPVDPAAATGKAAEVLVETKKALGGLPNMTKVMAISPAVLKGWLGLNVALAGRALSPAVREQLAISSAEFTGCEYCLSVHTFMGARVGKLSVDELELARDNKSADPHAAALLALSDAVRRGRGSVDESVVRAVRDAGVTDEEIAEVVAHIALNVFTNYFNILTDVENDYPLVTPHTHRA